MVTRNIWYVETSHFLLYNVKMIKHRFSSKGMHRKSLEAAEHLKEDNASSDREDAGSRTDTSERGTSTPTPHQQTPSRDPHVIINISDFYFHKSFILLYKIIYLFRHPRALLNRSISNSLLFSSNRNNNNNLNTRLFNRGGLRVLNSRGKICHTTLTIRKLLGIIL